MDQETDLIGDAPARLRLNDIRIVGPLLVLLLGAAVLINPSFVSAEQSVGGSDIPCRIDTSATGATLVDDCTCIDDELDLRTSVGVILPRCEEEPEFVRAPVRIPPPAAEIVGPTYLGPITGADAGLVTLQFPFLLSIFVGPAGILEVTNDAGVLVYQGQLGANRSISFPTTGSTTYTVKTVLINRAKYTEVVTPTTS